MPKKPKLLFGDALKAEIGKFTRDRAEKEQRELKEMGACHVVNDTFERIKTDMVTKLTDLKIRAIANDLTRSNIRDIVDRLNEYTPCSLDEVVYEDEIDDYNMSIAVARAYGKRLEALL